MTTERDPFQRYRERLDQLGFRPSSARGQNFLLDPTLHRWIAAAAAPGPRDVVLEIGVGLGFLTRELAALAGRVVGVEIDDRLFAIASDDLRGLDNVTLVAADALGGAGGSLPDAVQRQLQTVDPAAALLVVANLPYAVSGPLLAELLCLPRQPDRIVVLVQKELGERLAAVAGSPAYGGLSAQLQAAYRVQLLRTVPAEVFRPRPKVASAVVRLERLRQPEFAGAAAWRAWQAFVRALFGKRRKALRTTLVDAARATGGRVPDLPPDLLARRAETLTPTELADLCRRCAPPPAAPLP